MKYGVLKGSFDPISEQEIRYALEQRKIHGLQKVYFEIQPEGILPLKTRKQLLKKAVSIYRCLRIREGFIPAEELYELKPEGIQNIQQEIHQGNFRLAASGTRSALVQQGLYFEQIVQAHCSEHRCRHVKAMSALCRELAECHQVDPDLAWQAGMMHDITKKMDRKTAERILEIYSPEILKLNENIWHSYTAEYWLRENIGLYDEKILHAIRHHTLGDACGRLDRILFIADKTDSTRGYDTEKELQLCRRDLRRGAALVKKEVQEYLEEKEGIRVDTTGTDSENSAG